MSGRAASKVLYQPGGLGMSGGTSGAVQVVIELHADAEAEVGSSSSSV